MTATQGINRPTATTKAAVLELRDVSRVHGTGDTAVHALREVSLAGGLDTPTSGEVYVEQQPLSQLKRGEIAALRRRSLGYVFQDLNLIPALTAVENVMLPLELDGVRSSTARKQAREALAEVGVADLADRFPDEMSGGQQQRTAIARALVGDR